MYRAVILIMAFSLAACGRGGDSNEAPMAEKDIYHPSYLPDQALAVPRPAQPLHCFAEGQHPAHQQGELKKDCPDESSQRW